MCFSSVYAERALDLAAVRARRETRLTMSVSMVCSSSLRCFTPSRYRWRTLGTKRKALSTAIDLGDLPGAARLRAALIQGTEALTARG